MAVTCCVASLPVIAQTITELDVELSPAVNQQAPELSPELSASTAVNIVDLFKGHTFTEHDSVLVSDSSGDAVYQWQAQQPRVPASLVKLVTAWLAIEKWGLDHQFYTDFYLRDSQLWVKGYGDPYLISEELDLLAQSLQDLLPEGITSINIDNSYFLAEKVPGRSSVDDPYNAPLSAVAANFNTAMLQLKQGKLVSAEIQTPLTAVARELANNVQIGTKPTRINLRDTLRAQRHFANILQQKIGLKLDNVALDQQLPGDANFLYRHYNSHKLAALLSGTLEYSNNFVANQLFLLLPQVSQQLLSEQSPGSKQLASVGIAPPIEQAMSFARSVEYAERRLTQQWNWQDWLLHDGSGLSRQNRLNGLQLNQVLIELKPFKALLKEYRIRLGSGEIIVAYAKSGTLDQVHNLAGLLTVGGRQYQFVFMFNRKMPYQYRERLLQELANQLDQKNLAAAQRL
jgi:D-alanyl-D-alanine carboxypeptidase/D-alanyl-D-alanine-endopeptidase (penicillin-binding protein 4)